MPIYSKDSYDSILGQAIIEKDPVLGKGNVKQWLIDLKVLKTFYLSMLDVVIPDDDQSLSYNTKFYPFLLYIVIKNCQNQCFILLEELYKDSLLNWLKNTKVDYQEELEWVKNQTFECYVRFIIYESIFKTTFNIPVEELNLNTISKQIPIFSELNENQITTLKEKITDPIFYGIFKDIFNGDFKVLNCASSETNSCKIESAKFLYPLSEETNKPPLTSLPDCLKIASLHNIVIPSKQIAANLISATYSGIDAIMYGLTGVQKGYTLKLEEWTEKTTKNLAQIPSDLNKELQKLKRSLSKSLSSLNPSNVFEEVKPIIIMGSVGLGLFIATKFLPE